MESILPTDNYLVFVSSTFGLFVVAALLEIGGGYLVWLWLREKKRIYYGLVGGIILFVYGIIPTLQPANFVYGQRATLTIISHCYLDFLRGPSQ